MVLLDVIAATCPMPSIELADLFSPYSRREPVGVSLVLDIGNSRMCGVLVEDAATTAYADVSQTYRLELRDLSRVEHVYSGALREPDRVRRGGLRPAAPCEWVEPQQARGLLVAEPGAGGPRSRAARLADRRH